MPEFAYARIDEGARVTGSGDYWVTLCFSVVCVATKAAAEELAGKKCPLWCCKPKDHVVEFEDTLTCRGEKLSDLRERAHRMWEPASRVEEPLSDLQGRAHRMWIDELRAQANKK
jgi:hypothetical protein